METQSTCIFSPRSHRASEFNFGCRGVVGCSLSRELTEMLESLILHSITVLSSKRLVTSATAVHLVIVLKGWVRRSKCAYRGLSHKSSQSWSLVSLRCVEQEINGSQACFHLGDPLHGWAQYRPFHRCVTMHAQWSERTITCGLLLVNVVHHHFKKKSERSGAACLGWAGENEEELARVCK